MEKFSSDSNTSSELAVMDTHISVPLTVPGEKVRRLESDE
jgi:hypothetical protein